MVHPQRVPGLAATLRPVRRLVLFGLLLVVASGAIVLAGAAGFPALDSGAEARASLTPPSAEPDPSPSSSPTPAATPTAVPTPPASPTPAPLAPRPTPRPTPPAVTVTSAALENAVVGWRTRTGSPAVSVAVLWPGGRVWSRTAGIADAYHEVAATERTAFPFASVTKTFTAALILQLVDDGRLHLDQLVAPLLPEAGLHPKMTVRHLLDHTSGLPDFFRVTGIEPALNADTRKAWTVEDSLAYGVKDRVPPDTFWRYSNTGYVYLGVLAERLTGIPWPQLVRERLLDPLGLDTTFVQGVEAPRSPLARAHRVSGQGASSSARAIWPNDPLSPFTSVVTAAGAAGALAGSATDAARWTAALYGGDVISEDLVEEAVADVQRTSRFHPRIPYGLGVQAVDYDGRIVWGHTGSFVGIRNAVRWLPEERIAIAVLTNQSRYDAAALARELVAIVGDQPIAPACPGCE